MEVESLWRLSGWTQLITQISLTYMDIVRSPKKALSVIDIENP